MKVCIGASYGKSLINFRGELIRSIVAKGHKVYCVSIEPDSEIGEAVRSLGAHYYQIGGDRTGIGIGGGLKMIRDYMRFYNNIKPDVCFLYMSKPVAFGGFAAVRCKVPHINILVNGLENAYYRHTAKDWLVRQVMSFFYKYVGRHSDNVFIQNHDILDVFKQENILVKDNARIVLGSGVDMNHFRKKPLPSKPVFLMIARLLWSKGIREYLEAIKTVKQSLPEAEFMLVGGLDENDEAISKTDLDKFINEYSIKYIGQVSDVRPYIEQASVYVLPSYHEGIPRSVLEAMAMGRTVITTEAPGCRETVKDDESGFLVPVKDSKILAERIMTLAKDSTLRQKMGDAAYERCKSVFEVGIINDYQISEMGL